MVALGATVGAIGFTAFCLIAGSMICGDPNADLPGESDNPFQFVINLVNGENACDGLPTWFEWIMFILCTIPMLFVLWQFLEPFLNNAVTGTVVGVGAVLAVVGIVVALLF
jgi:hypothetical protein